MSTDASTYPVLPEHEPLALEGDGAEHPERRRVAIACIHGITGGPASMRPLGQALAARGFRVEVPRLPGHGTHVEDMRRTRYTDWRGEVLACVDRLRAHAERVLLVGLSMGGTLALDVASSKERDVAGVVSVNAQVLDREGPLVKLAPVIERLAPTVPAFLAGLRKDDIAKPGVSEFAYSRIATAAGNSFLRELPRIREQLPQLTGPVLIAHSRQDHSVPPANSRAIVQLLSGARVTELVLERSYHVATLDYDLELLVDRVAAFADTLAA